MIPKSTRESITLREDAMADLLGGTSNGSFQNSWMSDAVDELLVSTRLLDRESLWLSHDRTKTSWWVFPIQKRKDAAQVKIGPSPPDRGENEKT